MKKDKIEYFDIVNNKDEVVGIISEEEIQKAKPNMLRFINIIIQNSLGEIVVPKRSNNRKIFPNCYDFSVGGHVNSGEDYERAAYRELEEELGIKDAVLKEVAYFSPYSSDSNTFQKVYTLEYNKKITEFDRNGIDTIYYMQPKEINNLMIKEPEMFKTDYFMVMKFLFNTQNLKN